MEVKSNHVIFNPCFDKQPLGAVLVNSPITISVRFPQHFLIWNLTLIIENDYGEVVYEYLFHETITFTIPTVGIYWYFFQFNDVYGTHYLVSDENLDAQISDTHEYLWQLSIHEPFPEETKWFEGRIIYQIMVDRFFKGGNNPVREDVIMHKWNDVPNYLPINGKVLNNDFYGGDLVGIIKKLDYLKSLNVGIIYLNPIFEAYSNHKYDTGNYLKIDPMFGTEEDLINLIEEAKKRDIYIILDGVFNHTGDDSLYFNKYQRYDTIGAYNSKDSPYYDWYQFIDYPDDYMSWWGIKTLPSVNQENVNYLQFIDEVLKKWLELGISGFRLDVVDELNNNFVTRINRVTKAVNRRNILIGEVWEDASNKVAYGVRKHYFNGSQLDSVMNYVYKNAIISFLRENNVLHLRNAIRRILNNYPQDVVNKLMNVLDTHDTARIINNFAYVLNPPKDKAAQYRMTELEYQNALRKMKMAVILQFTLPGVPCIYYGDEVGLSGFDDPFCRRAFPWDNINHELLTWYRQLGKIRNDKVFVDGEYQEILAQNNIFIFAREKISKVIIIINNSDEDYNYPISGFDMLEEKYVDKANVSSQSGMIIKVK